MFVSPYFEQLARKRIALGRKVDGVLAEQGVAHQAIIRFGTAPQPMVEHLLSDPANRVQFIAKPSQVSIHLACGHLVVAADSGPIADECNR